MAQFILTARNDINRANGFHIGRGQEYSININIADIRPSNLFGNSRCKDALIQQFRKNGIELPSSDLIYNSRNPWDIKIK